MKRKLFYTLLFPLIGYLEGFFISPNLEWYGRLSKPFFNPPDGVFGPVWAVLYVFMGYYYASLSGMPYGCYRDGLLFMFYIQMILNMLWAPAFFYKRSVLAGLIVIGLLLLVLLFMVLSSFKKMPGLRIANLLMVPYLIWTSFAAVLNLALYLMN